MCIPGLSIGNDIVDLRSPEPELHPRYITKVFTLKEQVLVRAGAAGLWLTWAAKEAAYKAIKRLDRTVLFSPAAFEFDCADSVVTYGKHRLPCRQLVEQDCVAVYCATSSSVLQSMHHWISKEGELDIAAASATPSEKVRSFGARRIGELLGLDFQRLSFPNSTNTTARSRNFPSLSISGKLTRHVISFSHHGRFIACSFMHTESPR